MKDFFGDILIAALNTPKAVWLFLLGPLFCLFALFFAHLASTPFDPSNPFAGVVAVVQEHHTKKIMVLGLFAWGACWFEAVRLALKHRLT